MRAVFICFQFCFVVAFISSTEHYNSTCFRVFCGQSCIWIQASWWLQINQYFVSFLITNVLHEKNELFFVDHQNRATIRCGGKTVLGPGKRNWWNKNRSCPNYGNQFRITSWSWVDLFFDCDLILWSSLPPDCLSVERREISVWVSLHLHGWETKGRSTSMQKNMFLISFLIFLRLIESPILIVFSSTNASVFEML